MAEKSFSGGEAFEAWLAGIAKKVAKGAAVRVGFLGGGAKHDNSNLNTPTIAAIQEFGAPSRGIPPRPFMRPAVAKNAKDWGDVLASELVRFNYDARQAFTSLGQTRMAPDIQEAIRDVQGPALSEVTRMLRMWKEAPYNREITGTVVGEAAAAVAKGERASGINEAILQDSGEMYAAVDSEVVDS